MKQQLWGSDTHHILEESVHWAQLSAHPEGRGESAGPLLWTTNCTQDFMHGTWRMKFCLILTKIVMTMLTAKRSSTSQALG